MFEIGDKVIISNYYEKIPPSLERCKLYEITSCIDIGTCFVCQVNNIKEYSYNSKMFTLYKFRKEKIEKICLRLEKV
jgi:hypothetical protein